MTTRRRLTLKDKLEIIIRQARCPLCGDKLGLLAAVDFDHDHALARGGADAKDNLRAVHRHCHRVKTSGKPQATAAIFMRLPKLGGSRKRKKNFACGCSRAIPR